MRQASGRGVFIQGRSSRMWPPAVCVSFTHPCSLTSHVGSGQEGTVRIFPDVLFGVLRADVLTQSKCRSRPARP